MASQVAIVNRALTKLGEARITSLSDDLKPAREASSLWDVVRDAELREHNWNFAISRTSLAALSTEPSWGYEYEYQLPADCLRVIQVDEYYPGPSLSDYRGGSEAEYQIEGRKILSDLTAPLKIRYISRIEDTSQWDALFVEAFACRLAAELAEPLTQSNTKRDMAWAEYARAIKAATKADAIENPPEYLPDDSWILSRL